MDEQDGALSFDFEGGLDAGIANPGGTATVPLAPSDPSAPAGVSGLPASSTVDPAAAAVNPMARRSFRQTVCRHWLRSLCMKGDACGFLHQYDKARMPVCRFFRLYGECREQDCVYKHTNEDIKECNMYKLGFCPNGPDCRYRHAKLPGPPPSVEEVFQKIQQLSSFSSGPSNRFYQHRNVGYTPQGEKTQFQQGSVAVNSGATAKPSSIGDCATMHHQQSQNQVPQQQQAGQSQTQNLSNSLLNQVNRSSASPLPKGQSRYFIVKSCNRENLDLSVQKGIWATQRSNEAKLNEAFDTSENVILIFSINRTRNFQGCARMMSKTGGFGGGGWKYAHGTAHYGRNFSVKWLKLCELSFHKTRHLRNPYNESLPVKISRDCQELEPLIGEQLASLLYLEPDSELMAIAVAAETKREEEKTKGVSTVDGMENPDIVPFEENEEEEEEESDEEEESSGHSLGVMQARGGRGGPVWPPTLLARGGRSVAGMNPMGYPPFMMGPDAFGYGTVPTDGFSIPDVFAVAPRPFGPFAAPRFPGDFSGLGQSSGMSFPMEAGGPTSGMVFHGRPPQAGAMFQPSGVSMMMGAARGSFMGGLGIPPRVGRPIRMPFRAPPPPLPHGSSGQGKRDQRRSVTDRSSGGDRFPPGQEQSRAPDTSSPVNGIEPEPRYGPPLKGQFQDSFGVSNNFRHDDSESEDEAPRRSRHGEGKKKRRDSGGGDTSGAQWDMTATDQ
ncbi:LOW QUALITY PROTEIN: 30-kDa cleavage and polyadenylation specificity factor 30 [Nymphaea colorata]|nr:LOW QUALITY PROTEIN: 30-kDa cleavage and polyadenylation specificity factor 30 [Nymphaea colorata]